jgi:DNA repair photolyase
MAHKAIDYVQVKSILTRTTGFTAMYDYTLNPYSGCAFGCAYCYAAFFARDPNDVASWGRWVRVKENALDVLRKKRKSPLDGASIFMSSATDPYQPIEKSLCLTRGILEELLAYHRPRLVVQTRGPLVARDIDLLRQFDTAQVNMTVTTDDDDVRKAFEPGCASIQQRMDAIAKVTAAGIQTCITMTPILPVRDPDAFAERLLATGVRRFVAQSFHGGQARFVSGTPQAAVDLARSMGWSAERKAEVITTLAKHLPDLKTGRDGFTPHWDKAVTAIQPTLF